MTAGIGDNGGPPLTPVDRKAAGWIAVHRDVRDHPLVGFGKTVNPEDQKRGFCFSRGEAWLDLIMECRYREGQIDNGGRIMTIYPGELRGAVSYLAWRWNWSPKTVRLFLDRLESAGMIERSQAGPNGERVGTQKGNKGGKQAAIIRVCNYLLYQLGTDEEGQAQGQEKGKQGASKGQQIEQGNKGTREQDSSPLPPKGGEPENDQDQLPADNSGEPAEPAKTEKKRKARHEFTKAELAVSDEAVSLWNATAEKLGLVMCRSLGPPRRRRLLTRLDHIGGLGQFEVALSAIHLVPFMMGKTPPREGDAPFTLDIDRLLQTEGRLGDVLGKLIDKAAHAATASMVGPNGKSWGWWRGREDEYRAMSADQWRRALDAANPNGEWPWWKLGPPPGHPECLMHPVVIDEGKLIERYGEKAKQLRGGRNV